MMNHRATITVVAAASLCLGARDGAARAPATLTLASGGRAHYTIVVSPDAAPAERLAASELARYLGRITGATFPVAAGAGRARPIVLRAAAPTTASARTRRTRSPVRGDSLLLTGGSPRAVLYAAYDLLARLGCEWLAPELAHYRGAAELVPRTPTLTYAAGADVRERPRLAIRKLDVEEGISHDTASLRRLVEWMPKLRFNTLQVPHDYQGRGRVRWDAWRETLTPELDRRGLLIEVGGHGYQNYLNASMEGGRLFAEHPEWFGRDSSCTRARTEHLVFNTANADAVAYLTRNVVAYLARRPEIDIFDFWPPDGARWAECRDDEALGTPEDRQARLVNHVAAELRRVRPDVRLEMIAYAQAKNPPHSVVLDSTVLVDFCPIGQNFDVDIDDPAGGNNRQYVEALALWKRKFRGDVGLYSYYRRYAWRSLPVVLPRYIGRDMRWYASLPVRAASVYSEPGDWFTYETNYFVFGQLAWNPGASVDALLDRHARARYGAEWRAARRALAALEDVQRVYGSIQYSRPKPPATVDSARGAVERQLGDVRAAAPRAGRPAHRAALAKLAVMLDFSRRDLALHAARARGTPPAALRPTADSLVAMLHANRDLGVVLLYRPDDSARYLRHYGITGAAASAPAAPADVP
jgi:hypothetical protein